MVDLLVVATEDFGLNLEHDETCIFPLHDADLAERFGEDYLDAIYRANGVWHADDVLGAAGNSEGLFRVGDPCDGRRGES